MSAVKICKYLQKKKKSFRYICDAQDKIPFIGAGFIARLPSIHAINV